jgi:hypothetical protein
MWLWDINNVNFILVYKKYTAGQPRIFYYLSNGMIIRPENPDGKPQSKANIHDNKKEGLLDWSHVV